MKYSDKKEITIKYNRKKGQLDRWYRQELHKFDIGDNVRKIAKPNKTIKKDWDIKCMEAAKKKVKERDKVCQRCGTNKTLQCSHIISDARSTRLSVDPDNMKLLCYKCHLHRWHKNPKEAVDWFKEKRPGRYEMLEERLANEDSGSITIERWEQTYRDILTYDTKH